MYTEAVQETVATPTPTPTTTPIAQDKIGRAHV